MEATSCDCFTWQAVEDNAATVGSLMLESTLGLDADRHSLVMHGCYNE